MVIISPKFPTRSPTDRPSKKKKNHVKIYIIKDDMDVVRNDNFFFVLNRQYLIGMMHTITLSLFFFPTFISMDSHNVPILQIIISENYR
jgi:hypothetical protein